MFRAIGLTAIICLTSLIPAKRVAANDGVAAGLIGGIVGLMVGAEMQKAHCREVRCANDRAAYQKHLMREVLENYRPEYHHVFVDYVVLDLDGWLTPHQQRQLLTMMDARSGRPVCLQVY